MHQTNEVPKVDLMTTAEVAARLHKDIRTIHRMTRDGRLPYALKLDGLRGSYLFEALAVEEYEASHNSASRSARSPRALSGTPAASLPGAAGPSEKKGTAK